MIIEAKELLDNTENPDTFRMGVVVELFENKTAKITFDGEETSSQKQYSYLNNYSPAAGDRVLLASVSGTYIILGKINFKASPGVDTIGNYKALNVASNLTIGGQFKVSGNVGFFGAAPLSRYNLSYPSDLYTVETADATYSWNEQTMLNNLKTDIGKIKSSVYEIIRCLKNYNLA
jgi:hypothetical protein